MSNPQYPTALPIHPTESSRSIRDGREEDFAGDGTIRVRKLHADRNDFELKHPLLSSSELATLQSFYDTYGTATAIDLVWPVDGQTYVVQFAPEALRTQWKTASRRDVWVRLVAGN
jgi:hypothetical protein